LDFGFLVGDIIGGVGFRPFWQRFLGLGHQPLDGIFWLKFLLETRLQSESVEPLIGFLAFLVQKLWLIKLLFLGHNFFEPEMLENQSKARKTRILA